MILFCTPEINAPGGFPAQIFSLYNLEVLTLRNLLIKNVPEDIKNLTRLRNLSLQYNVVLDGLSPQVANCVGLEGKDTS